jgi:molybdenum cofactor biosynthesis protein B
MVRPARLELATSWFVARRSIQLSYGRAGYRPLSLTYGSMSHLDHKATSPSSVRCYVLTISDTRKPTNDTSGLAIAELLEANGHDVSGRGIVRDDPDAIRSALQMQLDAASAQVIITTGGTGITSRDSTYEVVSNLLEKRLEGFGELFRMLSYQEIGPSAMLSRACAGTAQGKIVVSLPGSENAVRLAMNKLLLPELGHLVRELSR